MQRWFSEVLVHTKVFMSTLQKDDGRFFFSWPRKLKKHSGESSSFPSPRARGFDYEKNVELDSSVNTANLILMTVIQSIKSINSHRSVASHSWSNGLALTATESTSFDPMVFEFSWPRRESSSNCCRELPNWHPTYYKFTLTFTVFLVTLEKKISEKLDCNCGEMFVTMLIERANVQMLIDFSEAFSKTFTWIFTHPVARSLGQWIWKYQQFWNENHNDDTANVICCFCMLLYVVFSILVRFSLCYFILSFSCVSDHSHFCVKLYLLQDGSCDIITLLGS